MIDSALSLETMQEKAAEAADFMRLFSTPSRLMLLCHIAMKERSVGEIQDELGFKQPALSQQLGELRQAGVVQTRRESRQVYYSIADERVATVMTMLTSMFCGVSLSTEASENVAVQPQALTAIPVRRERYMGEMASWARLDAAE